MPNQTLPAPGAHVSIGSIFKYLSVVEEVIGIFEGAKGLAVGAVQLIPDIKFQTGSEKFTLSGDANGISLTRTA